MIWAGRLLMPLLLALASAAGPQAAALAGLANPQPLRLLRGSDLWTIPDAALGQFVTSGTFGPSVNCGVGLARVPQAFAAPGTQLTAGPRDLPVEVAEIPIYKNGTCRVKIA